MTSESMSLKVIVQSKSHTREIHPLDIVGVPCELGRSPYPCGSGWVYACVGMQVCTWVRGHDVRECTCRGVRSCGGTLKGVVVLVRGCNVWV